LVKLVGATGSQYGSSDLELGGLRVSTFPRLWPEATILTLTPSGRHIHGVLPFAALA